MKLSHKNIMAAKGYLSAADAAKATGQHITTIYRWIGAAGGATASPQVKATRTTEWFINVASLIEYYKRLDSSTPMEKCLTDALAVAQQGTQHAG